MRIITRFTVMILILLIFLGRGKEIVSPFSEEQAIYLTDYSNNLQSAIDSSVLIYASNGDNSDRKSGAGIVWKQEGDASYILTCAHLFENAQNNHIQVFPFKSKHMIQGKEATLVGISNTFDIAVLKCKWKNPSLIKTSSAKDAKVAMPVFAFGNPNGKGASVSAGILSVPYEKVEGQFMHRIDCTLLPGNSGGGVFSSNGEIVGLIVSKVVTNTDLEGYGYAVPYVVADAIAKSILSLETNQPPIIPQFDFSYRVVYQNTSNGDIWEEEIAIDKVSSFLPLSVGDRVKAITINEQYHRITSEGEFASLLFTAMPHSTVFLTVKHYDEERTVQIRVGESILK